MMNDTTASLGSLGFDAEVENVFYNNMLLLKFPKSPFAIKKQVVLRREMFRQPNMAGFEVVMYFLFHKLNKKKCEEDFKLCWEVFDQKQASQFRRICAQITENIAKTNPNVDLPRNAGPIFVSPFGRKFYWLICNLSSYVLQKLGPSEEFLRSSVEEEAIVLKTRSKLNKTKIKMKLENHAAWKEKYNEVVSLNLNIIKELQKDKSDLKVKLFKLGKNIGQLPSDETPDETLNKLNKRWHFVYESTIGEKQLMQDISSALLNKPTDVLDCRKLNFNIPDILLERADEVGLNQEDLDQLYDKDKNINLKSLINICNASLTLTIDRLKNPHIRKLSDLVNSMEEIESKEKAHLDNLREFLDKVLQFKEKLTISVQQFRGNMKRPTEPQLFQDYMFESTPPYNFKAGFKWDSHVVDPQPQQPTSICQSTSHEKVTWVTTPKLGAVYKPIKSPDFTFHPNTTFSEIRHRSRRVDTPPLQDALWSSRRSFSLLANQSTPLGKQVAWSREASVVDSSDFRCSTPNQKCFNLDTSILESPLRTHRRSSGDDFKCKKEMGDFSDTVLCSILETTEDQSLGIISCEGAHPTNESGWLQADY